MTIEEGFREDRARYGSLAEERRKNREEYRKIWRDTQRQINDLTLKIADTNDAITRLGEKVDHLAEETHDKIDRLAAE